MDQSLRQLEREVSENPFDFSARLRLSQAQLRLGYPVFNIAEMATWASRRSTQFNINSWLATQNNRDPVKLWQACPRADWMLAALEHDDIRTGHMSISLRQRIAGILCAINAVDKYLKLKDDPRPEIALTTMIKYMKKKDENARYIAESLSSAGIHRFLSTLSDLKFDGRIIPEYVENILKKRTLKTYKKLERKLTSANMLRMRGIDSEFGKYRSHSMAVVTASDVTQEFVSMSKVAHHAAMAAATVIDPSIDVSRYPINSSIVSILLVNRAFLQEMIEMADLVRKIIPIPLELERVSLT